MDLHDTEILAKRETCKRRKEFDEADQIRDMLLGIPLKAIPCWKEMPVVNAHRNSTAMREQGFDSCCLRDGKTQKITRFMSTIDAASGGLKVTCPPYVCRHAMSMRKGQ